MVALEAMSCSVPVVGITDGGLQETVVDGVTGFLTQRDEDAFAQALATVLTDEALQRKMGVAGRELVEQKWTWGAATSRLQAIIDPLLDD